MSESDLDRLYHRASAHDPARPSAAARQAILDQAQQLVAQAQAQEQQASTAAPPRGSRWRTLLQNVRWQFVAPVAAAVLAGILLAPQWRSSVLGPGREITAVHAPAASPLQSTAPAAAAPPAVPPGSAPEAARSADLAQTESRSALRVSAPAPAPVAAPVPPRQNADESGNAAQSLALSQTLTVAINARDRNGRTALMLAVLRKQPSLVRELLARGANPNISDARGRTPLAVAKEEKQPQLINALLAAGAR